MSGFIALPREAYDVKHPNAWFPNDSLTAGLYALLVMRANWCDGTAKLPKQGVTLKAGQLVTSERDLADYFGVSRKRIVTGLQRATDRLKIAPEKGPLGTIITICDYEELYGKKKIDSASESATREPLGSHQGANHNKGTQEQRNKEDSLVESSASDSTGAAHLFISQAWNENHGSLPKAAKLTATRRRKMKARWHEEPDEAYWVAAVKKLATSSFCLEGKWATIDWLIANDTNHRKASEGKYDDRDTTVANGDPFALIRDTKLTVVKT